MKKIKHNEKNIEITSSGFNFSMNTVIYTINIDLDDIVYATNTFPFINGNYNLINNIFVYTSSAHVANFHEIMETNLIENTDVGLSGMEISQNFGTAILYNINYFNLDVLEWSLLDE